MHKRSAEAWSAKAFSSAHWGRVRSAFRGRSEPIAHTAAVGVAPGDWRALLAATTMLAITAAVAAYLPARRASRVDPMQVLSAE